MDNVTCVPRETLKLYLRGEVAEAQTETIEEHLAVCSICEQAISELESTPDILPEDIRDLVTEESQANSESLESPSVINRAIAAARHLSNPLVVAPSPLQKPAQIGAYQLLRSLGHGGMGQVYLARHVSLDKSVAIKLLFPRAGQARLDAGNLVSRFQLEMRAAGRLNHPAIVSATDAGEDHGTHYLVMEYIDGVDLSRLARAKGQLSIADACELMRQAALGLSHAHAEGIVHRDIKPSNLILDRQGRVKILDFGLAQWNLLNETANELTTVGQLMGTLDYMAPEQAERNTGVDYRADLYALGATLFRLLTGRPPLAASPDMTLLEKVRMLGCESAPSLSSLRSDAPPQLVKLVASLLNRNVAERPASAAHVAEALEPFCEGHQLEKLLSDDLIPAISVSKDQKNKKRRRKKWPWVVAATLILLIAAGLFIKLEADKGQLVIHSDASDVFVQVSRSNQSVKNLIVQPGTLKLSLASDIYRLSVHSPLGPVTIDKDSIVLGKRQSIEAYIRKGSGLNPQRGQPSVNQPYSPPITKSNALANSNLGTIPGMSIAPPYGNPPNGYTQNGLGQNGLGQNPYLQSTPTNPNALAPASPRSGSNAAGNVNHFNQPMTSTFVSPTNFIEAPALSAVDPAAMPNNEFPAALRGAPQPLQASPTYNGKSLDDWIALLSSEDASEKTQALEALQMLARVAKVGDMKKASQLLVTALKEKASKLKDNEELAQLRKDGLNELRLLEQIGEPNLLSSELKKSEYTWSRLILIHKRLTVLSQSRNLPGLGSVDNGFSVNRMQLDREIAEAAIHIVTEQTPVDKQLVEAAADYLLLFAGAPLAHQGLVKSQSNDPKNLFRRDPLQILDGASNVADLYWLQMQSQLAAPAVQTVIRRKARECLSDMSASTEKVVLACYALQNASPANLESVIANRIVALSQDKERLMKSFSHINLSGIQRLRIEPGDKLQMELPKGSQEPMWPICELRELIKLAEASDLKKPGNAGLRDAIGRAADRLDESSGKAKALIAWVKDDQNRPQWNIQADLLANKATSEEITCRLLAVMVRQVLQAPTGGSLYEAPPSFGYSGVTAGPSIEELLSQLGKATSEFELAKGLTELYEQLDETYAELATTRLIAAARKWRLENPDSKIILGILRGARINTTENASVDGQVLLCLSRCNSATRFVDVVCQELLTGDEEWVTRWMGVIATITPNFGEPYRHTAELFERLVGQPFVDARLMNFAADSALLWREYVANQLKLNRRLAQQYSQHVIKQVLAQPHLGQLGLLKLDARREWRQWLHTARNLPGQPILEDAVMNEIRQYLSDPMASSEVRTRTACLLATTGPVVERWWEPIAAQLRERLAVLAKAPPEELVAALPREAVALSDWDENEVPLSEDSFVKGDWQQPWSTGRYINSEVLAYLALVKRLDLATELDAELHALLTVVLAGRQPLQEAAAKEGKPIPHLGWIYFEERPAELGEPWKSMPTSAWQAQCIYRTIGAIVNDNPDVDSETRQLWSAKAQP